MSSDPRFDNPDRTDPGPLQDVISGVDGIEDAVPEADRLEQARPEVATGLDPEAPADTETPPRISDSVEANEADMLEQSIEVTEDDELREE